MSMFEVTVDNCNDYLGYHSNITRVHINKDVKTINPDMFIGCKNLRTIYWDADRRLYKESIIADCGNVDIIFSDKQEGQVIKPDPVPEFKAAPRVDVASQPVVSSSVGLTIPLDEVNRIYFSMSPEARVRYGTSRTECVLNFLNVNPRRRL